MAFQAQGLRRTVPPTFHDPLCEYGLHVDGLNRRLNDTWDKASSMSLITSDVVVERN